MNFSRENTKLRTLVVKAVNKTGPPRYGIVGNDLTATKFNTFLSMECPGYDYCYIQLKQVLMDAGLASGTTNNTLLFPFMVKANIGQIVMSNTNSFDNFLGSFYGKAVDNKMALNEQPIIELNGIPHGHYEFEITENDQAVDPTHLNIDDVTLVFSVYYCKR